MGCRVGVLGGGHRLLGDDAFAVSGVVCAMRAVEHVDRMHIATDHIDDGPFPPTATITVVDIEYLDREEYTYVFDQHGRTIASWSRDPDCDTKPILEVPEVGVHPDRQLVERVARTTFRDGSAPFRLLGVPHRFAEVLELCGAPEVTDLGVVAEEFEILDVSTWEG